MRNTHDNRREINEIIDDNDEELEEVINALSAGDEAADDTPDVYNSGGTGTGVTPVSDITGHARGDTRPIIGKVPMGAENIPPNTFRDES